MDLANPTPDPATGEALSLVLRLGCSFRLVPFFPGPGRPPSVYPIEVSAPAGFHFDDGQHTLFLGDWRSVVDRLSAVRIVPCDDDCGDSDLRPKA